MLLVLEHSFRVNVALSFVYRLQAVLNFHEVCVSEVYSIHHVFHVFVVGFFLLCKCFPLHNSVVKSSFGNHWNEFVIGFNIGLLCWSQINIWEHSVCKAQGWPLPFLSMVVNDPFLDIWVVLFHWVCAWLDTRWSRIWVRVDFLLELRLVPGAEELAFFVLHH